MIGEAVAPWYLAWRVPYNNMIGFLMHPYIKRSSALAMTAGLALVGAAGVAQATEGGVSHWPNGIEQHGAGVLPPPGFYGQIFAGDYRADTIRDDNGKRAMDVDLRVNAIAPRFVWVTEQTVFGGQLGFHALLPLQDMRINIDGVGSDRKRGLGDIQFGPVLGYHLSDKLHIATGADVIAPTGSYDKKDLLNLGANYYTIQATFAVSYAQPEGINADLRLMHDYNFENKDTNYTSGRELHADYTLGWGFGNGWTAGIGGHAYQQISDDKCGSNCKAINPGTGVEDPAYFENMLKATHGNRGRSFSVGPTVQYASAGGWFFSAKYQQEYGVENRSEGDAFWLKFTTAL